MTELPEGFVLDEPAGDDLPEGFVLDTPDQEVADSRSKAMQEGQLSADGSRVVRPDGTTIPVNPENSQGVLSSQQKAVEPKLKLPTYNRPMEAVRSALRGVTVGVSDVLGAAGGAAGYKALESVGIVPKSNQSFHDMSREMKTNQAATRDAYRNDHLVESYGAEIGGALIPALVTGGATLPAASTKLGKIGIGAGIGATQGGIYGASQADVGQELQGAGEGAAIGTTIGGAIPAVANVVGRAISPNASKNEALKKVLSEGGKPTIGMALGGRANALEEKLTSLPIMGDMINVARNKAVQSLEPAAYNRALSPIGKKLPKGLSGRDALVHTENALREKYDDVLNKIGAITPDAQFATKTQQLEKTINDIKMPQAQKDKFMMALDDVQSSIDENGVMTSQAYKELESNLGSISRKLGGSQDIYEGKMAPAVKQLQAELKKMLERQAGSHASDLADTNKGYANFKVLQKAAGGVGAEEGKFSPAQLQAAVRMADKSKDKGAFARGNALMQDLSEAGKTVMGSKTGNSFTADRAFMGLGALSTGAINPLIPAGLATGGAMYTQPVQQALVALAAKRGKGALAPKIAAALNEGSNYMLTPSVTGGASLAQ